MSRMPVPSIARLMFPKEFWDLNERMGSRENMKDVLLEGDSFPKINLFFNEESGSFHMEATIAGIDKNDIDVVVEDSYLVIKHTPSKDVRNDDSHIVPLIEEIKRSSFIRKFKLGSSIDAESISASSEDGILHLTIPLKPEAKPKPPRKIEF